MDSTSYLIEPSVNMRGKPYKPELDHNFKRMRGGKIMSILIYLNGKFVPKEEAKVSVFDHGYLYGDGVFEGIRAYNGRVFRLDEHLIRLYDSAQAINLNIPMTIKEMEEALLETLRKNELRDAYIRLVVSRGPGDLGLDPRKCAKPTVVIIADKINLYPQEMYDNGLKVVTVATRRNHPEALSPAVKSLNYLNNILARIEATVAGVEEAILLNADGYVTECTGDNLFFVKGNSLCTPPAHLGNLIGVTRNTVMEIASKLGMDVQEKVFTRYELYTADEVFLTGTAAEVVPVVEIDGRSIKDGKPGQNTLKLISAYRELAQREGTPIYK